MPWANTSHNPMLHMVIHIIPIGRITPISLGNQIPLLICLMVPNNSLVPHPSPSSSPVEQAILNLSKVVGNFVEEQKGINVQLAQRIDTVESTLNKRIDGLESSLNQKIENLQYLVTRITNFLEGQKKGRLPSQTLPNPKGAHEIGPSSNSKMDEVKAIITLRSGKEIEQPVPMTAEETKKKKEAEPERIIISEESVKKNMAPPFPQALRSEKKNPKPS